MFWISLSLSLSLSLWYSVRHLTPANVPANYEVDSMDDEQPLEFDMDALKDMTIKCLKKQGCISVKKLGEGCFNKVYILTMEDGFECVARLALPYFPRYKTESEVATMQLVRERTSIRVPEVYAWSADATNPIGAEYI